MKAVFQYSEEEIEKILSDHVKRRVCGPVGGKIKVDLYTDSSEEIRGCVTFEEREDV